MNNADAGRGLRAVHGRARIIDGGVTTKRRRDDGFLHRPDASSR